MRKEDVVLERAERLAAGLRPYHSPTVCPNCLACFAYGHDADDRSTSLHPNVVLLQYKCPVFWDAVAAFLMRERPLAVQRSLHGQLGRNYELCQRCPRDRMCGCFECDYLLHVLDACCSALYTCLCRSPSRKEALYHDTHTRWPDSTAQLLPSGPHLAARAMIDMLHTVVYAHHVLAAIIARDRATMMPIVSEDANRHALLSSFVSSLRTMTDNLEAWALESGDARDSNQPLLTPKDDITCPLTTICMYDEGPSGDTTYLRGYHRALSDALNDLVITGESCGLQPGRVMTFATIIWRKLPPHLQGETPSFVLRVNDSAYKLFSDPYRHLQHCLLHTRVPGCYGPGCPKRDTADRPWELRKCAKCHFTRYCSRECQRADWRGDGGAGEQEPHRDICDMLHELSVFAYLDMSFDDFAAACRRNEFPLSSALRLIKWTGGDPQGYGIGAPPVSTGEDGQ